MNPEAITEAEINFVDKL